MCGIRNPATRKKLLSEDRTFQEALKVAIADEIGAKESVQVHQQLSQPVNSVSKNPLVSVSKNSAISPSSGGNSRVHPPTLHQGARLSPHQSNSYTCFSCGNTDPIRSKCQFRNAVCRNCNTRGHIARACRKNGVNAVCVEDDLTEEPLSEEDELYMLYDVNAISRSEISVPLKIENNDCCMQLDTGCAQSLAPMSFFKEVCPDVGWMDG